MLDTDASTRGEADAMTSKHPFVEAVLWLIPQQKPPLSTLPTTAEGVSSGDDADGDGIGFFWLRLPLESQRRSKLAHDDANCFWPV